MRATTVEEGEGPFAPVPSPQRTASCQRPLGRPNDSRHLTDATRPSPREDGDPPLDLSKFGPQAPNPSPDLGEREDGGRSQRVGRTDGGGPVTRARDTEVRVKIDPGRRSLIVTPFTYSCG